MPENPMAIRRVELALIAVAVVFTVFFAVVVAPPVVESGDVIGAFGDGFVNSSASGYSLDVILCWVVLAIWVVDEARRFGVRGGWFCLLLGIVPGVVVGFALYLVVRRRSVATVEA